MENTAHVTEKKTMLSGIQPSGDLHLGNYLGAVKNWSELADEFNCFYFMADLHSITVRQNPAELRRRSVSQLAQYIACGLDPDKNTLFLQSHVHEHAELGWILNCYPTRRLWLQTFCCIRRILSPWARIRSSTAS